jgi:hypothetical protein
MKSVIDGYGPTVSDGDTAQAALVAVVVVVVVVVGLVGDASELQPIVAAPAAAPAAAPRIDKARRRLICLESSCCEAMNSFPDCELPH